MSTLQKYRLALQVFQSKRLRRDFADLAADPQYTLAGEFFFEEMYGPRDFSRRDAQGRRLHQFLHLVPGVKIHNVEQVLALLEITNDLDDKLVNCLLALDAPLPFDEQIYEHAYRVADNYADRLHQLELVRNTLIDVHSLTRSALLGITLRRSGFVAGMAGLGELHHFLLIGYEALQHVHNVHHFANTIYDRELKRLNRIYEVLDVH